MPAELRAGTRVAGWRLLRRIGQGTQSTVFLAEPESGGAAVALKLVPLAGTGESARAAFLAGADTARRLVHPGIVAVQAAGVEGALGWLAMEPVPGVSLERYTRPARLLPEALVLRVAEAVAAALAHAHQRGVVHRDVKPANVLVHWPSDTVKLADFGLARAADAGQTATGIVLGSPAYMAPEQLAGGVPTPASDLYALGVMLFQLLVGRLPHEADNLGELLRRVATLPAPDLRQLRPELPAPLAALVAQLLATNPAARPADAAALQQALRAVPLPAASGVKSR
jgi:serine/threonine-protein kinase